MRFRELVETPIDETERRGGRQSSFAAPDSREQAPRPLYLMIGSAPISRLVVVCFSVARRPDETEDRAQRPGSGEYRLKGGFAWLGARGAFSPFFCRFFFACCRDDRLTPDLSKSP